MENWPLPPFYKNASASEEELPLDAMLLDKGGIATKGHLGRFSPASGTFAFTEGGVPVVKPMQLSSLRSLHLSAAIHLVPDNDLMALYREAGGQVAEPDAQPFRVHFSDGEDLHGNTHGFVRTQYGVFLYLVTHDDLSVRVFVPESATASLQIGTLLGDALVKSGAISRNQVNLALGEQAKRRKTLLDEHFGDTPILDAKTLASVVEQRGGVPSQVRIADIIVNQGLASRDQLFEALGRMHKDKRALLGHILAEMGVVTEKRLAQAVADQLGVPIVAAASFAIKPAVLAMVDSSFSVAHQVLPLLATERTLVVAVENPADASHLDELRFSTERQVIPVIASATELATRIAAEYVSKALAGKAASIKREIDELGINLAREAASAAGSTEPRLVKETDTLLVRLVNNMIIYAHERDVNLCGLPHIPLCQKRGRCNH